MSGEEESARFRRVMGRFATGVAVVTGNDAGGRAFGFTANAVAAVSLDPVLVLVSVDRDSGSLPLLLDTGRFALSFLAVGDEALARTFARASRAARFRGLELDEKVTGAPVLRRALAWVDCSLWKQVEAGDHVLLIGEVRSCGTGREDDPLVFYAGRFGTVTP